MPDQFAVNDLPAIADAANQYHIQASSGAGRAWGTAVADSLIAVPTVAFVGLANTAISVSNMFTDNKTAEYDAHDVIKGLDAEAAGFYTEHQSSVDAWGTVVGGIIPGGLGIKALRLAAAGMDVGKVSGLLNLNKGLLSSRALMAEANQTGDAVTSYLSSQFSAVVAKGVGAQALDALAFETAATLTQIKAPAYSDATMGDLAQNVFWNSMMGGAVGGVFSGVKSAYVLGAARIEGEKATASARAIGTGGAGSSADVQIVQLQSAIKDPELATSQTIRRANIDANTTIRGALSRTIAGITENGAEALNEGVVAGMMKAKPGSITANIAGLEKITLLSTEVESKALLAVKKEVAIQKVVDVGTAASKGNVTKLITQENAVKSFVDLRTGEVVHDMEAVTGLHLGNMLKVGEEIKPAMGGSAVMIGKSRVSAANSYSPEVPVENLQAKRYLLSTEQVKPRTELNSRDYPEIEHHVQNWKGSILVDGEEYQSPAALRADMMQWKREDLALAGGTKKAEAALNAKFEAGNQTDGWDIAVPSKDMPKFLEQPTHAVFHYSADSQKLGRLGLAEAEAYIQAKDVAAQTARNQLLTTVEQDLGLLSAEVHTVDDNFLVNSMTQSGRTGAESAGAGFVSGANAALGTASNYMQKVGSWTSKAISKMQDGSGAALISHWNAIKDDGTGMGVRAIQLRNKLALSEAPYAMITDEVRAAYQKFRPGEPFPDHGLIRQDAAKWLLDSAEKGKASSRSFTDVSIKGDLHIETDAAMHDFQTTQSEINSTRRMHSSAIDSSMGFQNAAKPYSADGFKPVYNVPVDTNRYSHFAIVAQKEGVGATSHKSMLTAKSESALLEKIAAIEAHPETAGKFDFHFKGQSADYFKMKGDYDYARGMNDNVVDSTMRRRGMLGELEGNLGLSKKNVEEYVQDHIEWNNRMDAKLVRDMVEARYVKSFQQLSFLGEQHELAGGSTFGGGAKWFNSAVDNPYADMMKVALNISNKANYPLWSLANEFTERTASSAFGTVSKLGEAMFNSGGKNLDKHVEGINKTLDDMGIGKTYTAGMYAMHGDLIAQRPLLQASIQRAQSIFSGLTLGTDVMNAFNNAIGNVMLTGELHSLVQGMKSSNPAIAGKLAGVTIPGTTDSLMAPAKLIGSSISRYWKGGDVFDEASKTWVHKTGQELLQEYVDHGIVADEVQQLRSLQEGFASNLNPTLQYLSEMTDKGLDLGRKLSGNKFAERFSRFLAADSARQLTDHGLAQGLLSNGAEASTYWATTANRAQGVIISAQRPVAFQGPIGSAIGLFMSYQVNMMQQFARYAGTGQLGAAGVAMGTQVSLYGLQGLPAFNAINTHLIGNAGGNLDHKDMYSSIKSDMGNEVGDWLLYGAGSNALGLFHPDLKFNLYSRGDINPRQLTVLPTSIAETPIYKATLGTMTNFVDMVQNMSGGAGVRDSLLHAMEHNGLSRPISGLAAVLQGKETDSSGKLLAAVDNSFLSIAVKLAGGKELDSAQANDALYRMGAYQAHDAAAKKEIAQELRIADGHGADEEQLAGFQRGYVKAGGKLDGFNQWAIKQYRFATVPQANLFARQQQNSQSRNMQSIMGSHLLDGLNEDATVENLGS